MNTSLEELVQTLQERIDDTDLEYYADKPAKLNYALKYAISAINNRCCFEPSGAALFPAKYEMNVLDGAAWYLAQIGAEGYAATSENGVSVSWREMPPWLSSVYGGIAVG